MWRAVKARLRGTSRRRSDGLQIHGAGLNCKNINQAARFGSHGFQLAEQSRPYPDKYKENPMVIKKKAAKKAARKAAKKAAKKSTTGWGGPRKTTGWGGPKRMA